MHSGRRALPEGDRVALLIILLTLVFVSQVSKQLYRTTLDYGMLNLYISLNISGYRKLVRSDRLPMIDFTVDFRYVPPDTWLFRALQTRDGRLALGKSTIDSFKASCRFALESIDLNLPAGILAQTLPVHCFFPQRNLPSQTDLSVIFV